jgi:Single-stranded DNA-binding replication protein A (RPA), medium (30 kD) subunit
MSFSSPGANRNYPSPSTGDNPQRKATDEQTLVPVTISMLVNAAQNNKMLLDGREPHHIKVVAAITGVQMGSTSYSYTIEDGTGAIDVKEWLDEGNIEVSKMREEAAVEHQYVRIIGKLEEYDGKPQIVAHTVRKLPNGNELTYHFLEVVYEGEKYKQSQQIVGSPSYAMGNMNFGGSVPMQASRPIINGGQGEGGGLVEEIKSFLAGREYRTKLTCLLDCMSFVPVACLLISTIL